MNVHLRSRPTQHIHQDAHSTTPDKSLWQAVLHQDDLLSKKKVCMPETATWLVYRMQSVDLFLLSSNCMMILVLKKKPLSIYTNKKNWLCQSVSVSVCPAMRFVVLQRIELKLGRVVGHGPPRFVVNFSKWPDQRSKVIQRSICLRNALWLPNLVGRTPDWSVMHCWGRRSRRGHPGSTRGQIAQECPMATKFGRKNPWPECNALVGSKVMQGSAGVNQRSNCLGMP